MSHSVFQTAQITPLAPTSKTLACRPLLPVITIQRSSVYPPVSGKVRKCFITIKASSSAVVDDDAIATLERCFQALPPAANASSLSSAAVGPVIKGQYSAFGAVTLEKSKIDMTQKQTKSSPELSTGGGGGNIGKGLSHGGGDGGDDGGDDDDYFDNFDEGDEGDDEGLFRRKIILAELFDRKFVDAVLNEWQKTMMDLPAGFCQAYEMGLVSSAQMVRFLAINARPTIARFIARSLPQEVSRAFVGRMTADSAFLIKLSLELATTFGYSVWWEIKNRKGRIKQEWALALVNVLTVTACKFITFCLFAPCHSYGKQTTLQKLPNNIFEKSYPFREFDFQKRLQSILFKAAELGMVGFILGAAQGAVSNFVACKMEGRLSVTVPSVSTNALGYGAFLGLDANFRHQLLCGFDRVVTSHFDVIVVALFFITALRFLNVQLENKSMLAWLGVEVDPLAQSDDLLKANNRPSEGVNQSSSKWFISKNAIVSGLGLLGIKQGKSESNIDGEAPPPKGRRKRMEDRRKVVTS